MASLQAAHDIQHGRIDDSIVPGTVDLVDVDHKHSTKHSRAHKDIILVPTPSDDPDDPLNWSPRRFVRCHSLNACSRTLGNPWP